MAYEVGQTVYVDASRYSEVRVHEGTVASVSPTGVVRVTFKNMGDRSFLKNGMERGADKYHPMQIISKESYEQRLVRQKERAARLLLAEKLKKMTAMTGFELSGENRDNFIALAKSVLATAEMM